jgi:hypothetical protein
LNNLHKKLSNAGEVIISQKNISKYKDGIVTTIDYDNINEVDVDIYTRKIFFPANYDGSKTYLVRIIYKDQKDENFVISSQSIDKPEVNFIDTIKNIEKIVKKNLLVRK